MAADIGRLDGAGNLSHDVRGARVGPAKVKAFSTRTRPGRSGLRLTNLSVMSTAESAMARGPEPWSDILEVLRKLNSSDTSPVAD